MPMRTHTSTLMPTHVGLISARLPWAAITIRRRTDPSRGRAGRARMSYSASVHRYCIMVVLLYYDRNAKQCTRGATEMTTVEAPVGAALNTTWRTVPTQTV